MLYISSYLCFCVGIVISYATEENLTHISWIFYVNGTEEKKLNREQRDRNRCWNIQGIMSWAIRTFLFTKAIGPQT